MPQDQKAEDQVVFVFGSNLLGLHGAGAALCAAERWGAQEACGRGRTGSSYALPTKDKFIQTLPLALIQYYVNEFLLHVRDNPKTTFLVTRIGCGLAGYTDSQIAPMFWGISSNAIVDVRWKRWLPNQGRYVIFDELTGGYEICAL